jgi:hypothetical protein
MLGNHACKASFAMLSNAEQYLAIFLIYMDLCCAETERLIETVHNDILYP